MRLDGSDGGQREHSLNYFALQVGEPPYDKRANHDKRAKHHWGAKHRTTQRGMTCGGPQSPSPFGTVTNVLDTLTRPSLVASVPNARWRTWARAGREHTNPDPESSTPRQQDTEKPKRQAFEPIPPPLITGTALRPEL